jgi:hypothetical protein
VAAYVQAHLAHLIPAVEATPRPRRRWQCAHLGELWQHDSSIHDWWPAQDKPVLLLTLDDHSRKIVAGRFVPADTTWLHFQHFRTAFETHGLPAAIYTDALSLFGHRPTADALDPCSQFQRALTACEASWGCGGTRCGRKGLTPIWVKQFVSLHAMRSRTELEDGTAKVAAFLSHLAVERRVAAATLRVSLGL